MKTLVAFIFLEFVYAELDAQILWLQRSPLAGPGKHAAVGFAIGNKGYIGTGQSSSLIATDDFWEYDPSNDSWMQKANFGGAPRNQAVGFSIGDKGYIALGLNSLSAFLQDVWEYDPAANTWTQKATFGGIARDQAVAFSIGSKGYVAGGGGMTSPLNDLWEYDPVSDVWMQKVNFANIGRQYSCGFSILNYGYIALGRDTADEKSMLRYDPLANTWTACTDFPGTKRENAAGFSVGNKGYVTCGQDPFTGMQRDCYEYDPQTNSWTAIPDFGGYKRIIPVAFTIDCRGYVVAGYSNSGPVNFHQDLWMLDIPNVPAAVSGDQNITSGFSAQLYAQGSGTYSWSPSSSVDCDTCSNVIATPSTTTTYTLTVTNHNGCITVDSLTVVVSPTATDLFIPTLLSGNQLLVVNGLQPNSSLFIYDNRGRLVFHSTDYANDFGRGALARGVYSIRFIASNGTEIKQKLTVIQ